MMGIEQLMAIGGFGLVVIGLAGIVLSHHLIRIIFAIALLEAGANLLLLLASYRPGAAAPIIVEGQMPMMLADSVPQALVLTSIVIGVGILAVALSLALRIQRAWQTLDIREIRQRIDASIAEQTGTELPSSAAAPVPLDDPSGARP